MTDTPQQPVKFAVKSDVDDIREKVDKMFHLLTGNGEVGLAERVRNVERFVLNQKKLAWLVIPWLVLGSIAMIAQTVLDFLTRSAQ